MTGSRGFIGSKLVSFLNENDYDVFSFDGDIADRDQVLNFEPGKEIEAVVHLASVIDRKDEQDFRKVNIEGTKNVVDLCKKNKVKRLIFLSSLKVFSRLNNLYNESKKEAEKIIISSGVPYIILRPSMVYGPGDKKNIKILLKLSKTFPIMPGLKFRMQLLFVDDLAKIIMGSLILPPNQIINIAGRTVSYMDLLKAVKELGCNFSIINWPNFFALILKTVSHLPFSPMPAWQIDSILADEIFEEYGWREIFNIKETVLREGLLKTIENK